MIMSRGSGDIRAMADPDAVMSPLPGLVSKPCGLHAPHSFRYGLHYSAPGGAQELQGLAYSDAYGDWGWGGSGLQTFEHCRGSQPQRPPSVLEPSIHCLGFSGRIGDPGGTLGTTELASRTRQRGDRQPGRAGRPDATGADPLSGGRLAGGWGLGSGGFSLVPSPQPLVPSPCFPSFHDAVANIDFHSRPYH